MIDDSRYVFAPRPRPAVPVRGEAASFPVNRIFCVGRNYADHAKEMGFAVDREAPFYFLKPACSLTPSGTVAPYPPGTENFHYEMEFVVAIGKPAFRIAEERALEIVYGYGAGLDMTRRDLQIAARDKGRPWDFGKSFENAAVLAPLTKASDFGPIATQRIGLKVNGAQRQDARLSDMICAVPALISYLSGFYQLVPGDLLYTGTPAGVGPLQPGDRLEGEIDGLDPIALVIGPPL